MAVYDLMKQRCSVRAFQSRDIDRETLTKVLEAARVAPSACNRQPWLFIVAQEPELRLRISKTWGKRAPALIVVCGDHVASWKRKDGKDHCDIDIAIAVDHMTLAATELGLGTCWVCSFDAVSVREVLGLPAHLEPIVLLPIGYPSEPGNPDRHGTERKSLSQIVSWDGYSKNP